MTYIDIPTKTLAAVLVNICQPLQLVNLEIPDLKAGQVLVKICYSGICRSQLNEIDGIKGRDPYLPHTLGHEGSGIVIKVGDGVRKIQPGDHVVLSWIKGLGADVPSTIYQSCIGPVNSGAISTFLQYSIISENRIIKIPKHMHLREAALFGCALPTGMGIVLNNCRIKPGESIAVFGVGGVGMAAILAARLSSAYPIIAVDIDDNKLIVAKKMGATHVINSAKEEPYDMIMGISSDIGMDHVIEAIGNQKTMELSYSVTRANGGCCVVAGNPPIGTKISINPYDLIYGKNIRGTWGGESNPDVDIPRLINLYLNKKFSLADFLTDDYKLDKINEALEGLRNSKGVRLLINLNG